MGQQWQGTNLDPLNEGQCRDAAGIGAGLAQTDGGALCQQYLQHLAQAHGGDVWLLNSEVGKGSTFSVRLPKQPKVDEKATQAIGSG